MTDLAVIERPGMSPYRARALPIAYLWDNDGWDDRFGVVVARTHDLGIAEEMADILTRQFGYGGMDKSEVQIGWVKQVPRKGDLIWLFEAKAKPNWAPGVWFEVDRRHL